MQNEIINKVKKLDFYKVLAVAVATLPLIMLLVVSFIAYQNFVVIPKQKLAEAKRVENEKMISAILAEAVYTDCKANAFVAYTEDWDTACDTAGKGPNCSLYRVTSDRLDDVYQGRLDKCFKEYSIKVK